MRSAAIVLAIVASLTPTGAKGQETSSPEIRAVRLYDGHPPVLDGRLEAVWDRAPAVVDVGPDSRPRRREKRTEVRFLYDHESLYVAARMHSDDPTAVRSLVTRRDDPSTAESFVLSLDVDGDGRTAHSFEVTAGGTRIDYFHPRDRFFPRDRTFDAVWTATAAVDTAGWAVEMRIPFSQLRRQGAVDGVWGVNWARFIPAGNRRFYWIRVPPSETGWASRFGRLVGVTGVGSRRYVEVVPYVIGERTLADADSLEALEDDELRFRAGADLQAVIGRGRLDVTINPDFGQIEVDPAEVNLTAYETFFTERRPFFVEAGQELRAEGPLWLYTRRIGAAPRPADLDAIVTVPRATTVLGAGRFTARSDGGWSIATLAALTAREEAPVVEPADGLPSTLAVEPLTGYGAARLQRQFGAGGSTVGGILTFVQRDVGSDPGFAGRFAERAAAGGGDWTLRSASGTYAISGHLGFSLVQGDTARIHALQQSSAHWFQRPDADHVEVEPTATSLAGWTGSLRAEKRAGKHWRWGAGVTARSPGFDINDAGIMRAADDIDTDVRLRYRRYRGGRHALRSWELALFGDAGWNFAGVRQYARPTLYGRASFRNLWGVWAQASLDTRALSDDLTRGGPLMETARGWRVELGLNGDRRAASGWRLSGSAALDEAGGGGFSVGGEAWFRPGPRTEISVVPGFARWENARQYYATLPGGPPETFDQRYVFSTIDLREFRLQVRLQHNLTPDFGLQLYTEPFSSSGHFSDFGELPAPRARDPRPFDRVERQADGSLFMVDGSDSFTLENADFTVMSLRSTAVLRWEWSRGSTLFLIWQRDQFASIDEGDPTTPGDLLSILPDTAEGIVTSMVAVKLTWWLPLD